MVRLGDVLTCQATVTALTPREDGLVNVALEIWADNQRGEKVTSGSAEIEIPA
jgi:acyl dehydratase